MLRLGISQRPFGPKKDNILDYPSTVLPASRKYGCSAVLREVPVQSKQAIGDFHMPVEIF
jgi:hypothetical protein